MDLLMGMFDSPMDVYYGMYEKAMKRSIFFQKVSQELELFMEGLSIRHFLNDCSSLSQLPKVNDQLRKRSYISQCCLQRVPLGCSNFFGSTLPFAINSCSLFPFLLLPLLPCFLHLCSKKYTHCCSVLLQVDWPKLFRVPHLVGLRQSNWVRQESCQPLGDCLPHPLALFHACPQRKFVQTVLQAVLAL